MHPANAATPARPFTVLAVCTGNICRSPAVERLLAAELGAETRLDALGLGAQDALGLAEDLDPAGLATPFAVSRADLRELLLGATRGEPVTSAATTRDPSGG